MFKKSMILRHSIHQVFCLMGLGVLLAITGCQTGQNQYQWPDVNGQKLSHSEAIILREGDALKITFAGSPDLNSSQQVRRDGKIVLATVGEVKAAGLTPAELEKEIVKLYSTQLLSPPEVTVTVESSAFPVFVTGAVARPGKIMSDHPITVLEAIMEAGGFDYTRANLKAVVVIRNEEGRMKTYPQDLKAVMSGKLSEPFYLQPSDIVQVPEKFNWF